MLGTLRVSTTAVFAVVCTVLLAPAAHAAEGILYDQLSPGGTPSVIRSHATGLAASGGLAADDFTVPTGPAWSVDKIRLRVPVVPESTVGVVVYADATGAPGAAVCAQSGLAFTAEAVGPFEYVLTVPLAVPCVLGPGTYWLSVFGEANDVEPVLNWYASGGAPLGVSGALFQDAEFAASNCPFGSWHVATTCTSTNGKVSDPPNAVNAHFQLLTTVPDPPPNTAPTALDDAYATEQGVALVVAAPGVLANDSDPDPGTTLTALLETGPSNGTLVLNADGSFVYTPNAVFSGTDSFTYRASDGPAVSAPATVTIAVKSTPAVIDDLPNLTAGQKDSLKSKLDDAAAFFAEGKLDAACGKLNAFIGQVSGLFPRS